MHVYGLTGGIGAGKSSVADLLEEYGIPVVSADELSRMVVAPGSEGLADVVAEFGQAVLDERGDLDRRAMGKLVFSNAEKRKKLEAILHPRIRERYEQVLDALEKAGHPVMVYEVPLLFEKGLQADLKAVILVTASDAIRMERVQSRDGLAATEVQARMAAQMPERDKLARADYVVPNDGSLDDLREEVERLISRFLKMPSRVGHSDVFEQATDPSMERRPSEEVTLVGGRVAKGDKQRRTTRSPSKTPTEPSGVPVQGGPPPPPSRTPTVPPDYPAPPPPLPAAPPPRSPAPPASATPTLPPPPPPNAPPPPPPKDRSGA